MSKLFAALLFAACGSVAATAMAAESAAPPVVVRPPAFSPPPVREARLPNGVRVLLVERHELPLVAFHVTSNVGPALAPSGVASFATDVAFRATENNDNWELNYGLTW